MELDYVTCTSLFRHASLAQYMMMRLFQPTDSGVCKQWGKLVPFSEDRLQNRGLEIVLAELKAFPRRRNPSAGLRALTISERKCQQKLLRDYWQVDVSQQFSDELCIQPMAECGRGRAMGIREANEYVKLPSTNEKFFAALQMAFSQCCRIYL